MAAFGKGPINWGNFLICCIVSLGQIAFGYPASIIGTTLGQPAFLSYMKLVNEKGEFTDGSDGIIGAFSGVFQAGAFVGIIMGSYVNDKWGRKAGVVYCAVLSIFGGVFLCAAQSPGMFIAFRFFAGAGSWGFLSVTPLYTAELAPPAFRGFFVGMNGVMIGVGYAMASYMGLAFFYASNPSVQWRGPLGIALVFPIIMLVALPFIPESPRYLLMVNKVDKAWEVIEKLHSVKGEVDQDFARSEFYQMQKQIEFDRKLNPTWMQMFRKPSYRKRTLISMGFAFVGQSTAVLVINNYGPILYRSLGFDSRDQLILQCGWISVSLPGNFIGAVFMDKLGRRPLMIGGVAGCCLCLILEAAMVAQYAGAGTNKAGLGMAVAAFYLFLAFYSLGIDVAGVVFYSELFPNHIRSRGLALSMSTIALTDLVYLQATQTAFTNIGWKFYLVFIIISGLGVIWAYFTLPETKGVPLEEIAALFGDNEEVMVFSKDIHIDHNTHQLVIDTHENGDDITQEVTEIQKPKQSQVDSSEEKV